MLLSEVNRCRWLNADSFCKLQASVTCLSRSLCSSMRSLSESSDLASSTACLLRRLGAAPCTEYNLNRLQCIAAVYTGQQSSNTHCLHQRPEIDTGRLHLHGYCCALTLSAPPVGAAGPASLTGRSACCREGNQNARGIDSAGRRSFNLINRSLPHAFMSGGSYWHAWQWPGACPKRGPGILDKAPLSC